MEAAADFPIRLLVSIGALIAVLALAWAVLRFFASLGGTKRTGNRLKILETLPLGSRERLVLVRLDSRDILVGVSAHGVSVIETLDAPEEHDNLTSPPLSTASTKAT